MNPTDHLKDLQQQHSLIRDRIRAVVHGNATGLYLHGRPGTSKTFLVETTLKGLAVPYVPHRGVITANGFLELLKAYPQSTIVLDDVSALFKDQRALQMLLAALGSPPDGSRIRRVSHATAYGSEAIDFSGGVVAISNLPLEGHASEVLAALRDRVHVIGYEPPDAQMEAFIYHLAGGSPKGVPAMEANMIASFLVTACRESEVRPSVRLFMDKAVKDYLFWKEGHSECHWQDLIRSSVAEQLVPQQHCLRDVSRKEKADTEKRLAQAIYSQFLTRAEREQAWRERVGTSPKAFYRRLGGVPKAAAMKEVSR
jgi:hypothetical protein